jgi:hypothetical protein
MKSKYFYLAVVITALLPISVTLGQDSVVGYYTPSRHTQKRFVLNYNEAGMAAYTLPDPLMTDAGKPVTDATIWWEQRRPEILALFENEMYGRTPGFSFANAELLRTPRAEVRAEKKNALNGKAVRREVRLHFTTRSDGPYLDVLLYMPVAAKRPVPAFVAYNYTGNHTVSDEPDILLCESYLVPEYDNFIANNRATEQSRGVLKSQWPVEMIIERGYALATACYQDVDPDFDDDFQNGIHPYFYKEGQKRPAPNEWGSIGAWAWGLSRILDYLQTEPAINATQVTVAGLSRFGKTALWCGAQDQRFAVVIANGSGCGGAALTKRDYGETIGILNYVRPHWFCGNFNYYSENEAALPFDQHQLLALIAPRPVFLAVGDIDRYADPKGEFLSALNADPVYRLLSTQGMGDIPEKNGATRKGNMVYDAPMPPVGKTVGVTIGFHIHKGGHEQTAYNWEQYLNFTDTFFKK